MRVLITRPAYVAAGLSQKIKDLNAIPELLPTIEIRPTPHQQTLILTIQKLNTAYIAIFISRAAVHFGMNAIKQHWHSLPPIHWAAIGPGTAEVLQQHHIDPVIVPKSPPYETETLLQLEIFQTIQAKKIFVFRGNGGRPLLNQVLQERGATVELVEVYQRTLPTIDIVEKLITWRHNPLDVIVTTSMECLNNLLLILGPHTNWLKQIPLIVVGLRMYELANKLEFKYPIMAPSADDASIIKVLTKFKDNEGENGHL